MARFPQGLRAKGSQRWIQHFVNQAPEVLEKEIGVGPIEWLSPLADDDYAEYRDQAFLDRLGITPSRESLSSFWPTGGPNGTRSAVPNHVRRCSWKQRHT